MCLLSHDADAAVLPAGGSSYWVKRKGARDCTWMRLCGLGLCCAQVWRVQELCSVCVLLRVLLASTSAAAALRVELLCWWNWVALSLCKAVPRRKPLRFLLNHRPGFCCRSTHAKPSRPSESLQLHWEQTNLTSLSPNTCDRCHQYHHAAAPAHAKPLALSDCRRGR